MAARFYVEIRANPHHFFMSARLLTVASFSGIIEWTQKN